MKRTIFILFLFLLVSSQAQVRHKLDSMLLLARNNPTEDTILVKAYNEIAYSFTRITPDSTKLFVEKALTLSKKLNFKKGEASAYNTLGVHYHLQAQYPLALEYYEKSRKLKQQLGDKKGVVSSQNNMGIVYYLQGQYSRALKNYESSLQIQQESKDSMGMANTFNYIASVYYFLSDYDKALRYYLKAQQFCEKINDRSGLAQAHNNIGIIYNTLGNSDKAIENYNLSLTISLAMGDKYNTASAYNNLGTVHQKKKNHAKALEYFNESLRLAREINNVQGIAYNLSNIGSILEAEKKYKEALQKYEESLALHEKTGEQYSIANTLCFIGNIQLLLNNSTKARTALEKAIAIAIQIGAKDLRANCYNGFAAVYKMNKDFKRSYDHMQLYTALRDSILSEDKNKSMAEMQTRFDTDKKEKEIAILTKNKDLEELQSSQQQANIKKQKVAIYSSLGGITLALSLAFFVFKGYSQKKKANALLEEKNEAIRRQKQVLEEKNIQITDSIDYAKSIQEAILPLVETVKGAFADAFILFKPKDVVSGDFYWMWQTKSSITLAAIDCVGHGVPGAFMALHSYNLLERIVKENDALSPALILDQLNHKVLESLNQQNGGSSAKHGMDLAMIKIKENSIDFSGARNPLVIVSPDKELIEIKADRMYVGGAQGNFTANTAIVEKGSMLYLFTDGYADQKGGPQNKKFFAEPLRALFKEIAHLSGEEQQKILEERHLQWKGAGEQLDDILILGIRV